MLVHELFGGELLKTPLPAGDHFYNRIEDRRYDFTASQFDEPIAYLDLPTSRADAEQGATSDQLAELRAVFEGVIGHEYPCDDSGHGQSDR
ncbi:YunG family protein [Bradyrhizobium genosp. A]|uniref:YunG family protein n=1 Tax=Bradyrhizobium genosp. A TaxID=83626 RepID=UPI003CF9D70D